MAIDRIVAFAAISALLCVVVKQTRPEFALALTLFSGAALLMSYAAGLWEAVDAMSQLGARAGLSGGFVRTLTGIILTHGSDSIMYCAQSLSSAAHSSLYCR